MSRPASPYNVRLASAALASLRGRPTSTDIIAQHAVVGLGWARRIYNAHVRAEARQSIGRAYLNEENSSERHRSYNIDMYGRR